MQKWKNRKSKQSKLLLMLKLQKPELKEKNKKLNLRKKPLRPKLRLIEKKKLPLLIKEERLLKPLKKPIKHIKENLILELMLLLKLEPQWLKNIRLNLRNN